LGVERVVKNGKQLEGVGGAGILLAASSSNDAIVDSMKRLKYGGRVVLMGIGFGEKLKLHNFATLMKIVGRRIKHYLVQTLRMAAEGKVKPIIETEMHGSRLTEIIIRRDERADNNGFYYGKKRLTGESRLKE